jgi:hypothetical protein
VWLASALGSAKEIYVMINGRFLGGLLFIVAAAFSLLGLEGDASVPIAGALLVTGIALMVASRRSAQKQG